ncbi:response regulator transcription factor [Mycobacterium sp. CVI_P3]|uniref:helix-turn-helix domain-containing protein n=1 Tax=Mycobacterium pinniadriaticum TaxID=2994102 RepID=UPI0022497B79|nr:response regulator transcription factor [Mycobacterium pinniadriaticum]MCX2932542.1 response regulator transcription factor [Mycobacterium pinniadriaticum]
MIGRLDATVKTSGATSLSHLPAVVGGTARVRSDVRRPDPGDLIVGVQKALDQLIVSSSMDELLARAAEAAGQIGFSRVLLSRVDHGIWLTQSAHAVDDPDFAEQLLAFGTAHSRALTGQLLESEMLLSGVPILVSEAQSHPRVFRKLVRFARTTDYVAAPVQAWGFPVAMVHADRYPDRSVAEMDRRLLGLYAGGLGLAIERAQLADRLKAINQASVSPGDRAGDGCEGSPNQPAPIRLAAVSPLPSAEHATERLSPREWDVLRSIALGKTNAQIATGLFLAENTVKVHVKRILRKLGAANRTEAAALYHRLTRRGP